VAKPPHGLRGWSHPFFKKLKKIKKKKKKEKKRKEKEEKRKGWPNHPMGVAGHLLVCSVSLCFSFLKQRKNPQGLKGCIWKLFFCILFFSFTTLFSLFSLLVFILRLKSWCNCEDCRSYLSAGWMKKPTGPQCF
jgi:hypothetical protein